MFQSIKLQHFSGNLLVYNLDFYFEGQLEMAQTIRKLFFRLHKRLPKCEFLKNKKTYDPNTHDTIYFFF